MKNTMKLTLKQSRGGRQMKAKVLRTEKEYEEALAHIEG